MAGCESQPFRTQILRNPPNDNKTGGVEVLLLPPGKKQETTLLADKELEALLDTLPFDPEAQARAREEALAYGREEPDLTFNSDGSFL